jgi:uncharacterized membrane protein YhaH (DUF805 family)
MSGPGAAAGLLALHGRIGRLRFLLYVLYLMMGGVLVLWVVGFTDSGPDRPRVEMTVMVMMNGSLVGVIGGLLILSRRRLHDVSRSGWWCVLLLVPVAGILVLLVLLVARGERAANAFGTPPARHGGAVWAAVVCAPLLAAALRVALTRF